MNRTEIEYLDFTWNPIVGCNGIGCAVSQNCWARNQAKRQKHQCKYGLCYSFTPHAHYERFTQPLKRKKPSRIGVCFMGDFYDIDISESVRARLKVIMLKASQHQFLVLTKQPQNILTGINPSNLAIGVSVNNNQDLWRLDVLRQVETTCRVVSFEPLYERLKDVDLTNIDWIIIGAQTRPTKIPEMEWIGEITSLGIINDIPVFHKNNLNLPDTIRLQEFPKW